ncbi:hypothetical protein [Longimicrobium sp.]|uniref:tetratricopeptide repeat protein n=1 Tax=Longimicrobium sp. TaxID=2029185 RepID=UPI002C28E4F1|nr:hypothetical protein [Longimicrobium sp.]HSU15172.1 hypothetical protein [Longimicrobium sp.]
MWIEAPPAARSRLFRRSARESGKERRRAVFSGYPELHEPLRTFAALAANSGAIDPLALCRACMQIADWAAENSLEVTSLHFATAAAAVAPENAEAANLAGLMYRRAGDWQRAEMFYPRAIALARRQRNATEYVCGHIGYAALLYSRGIHLEKAVRHLNTAARVAADNGSFWLAGHALHDSMLLHVQRSEYEEAEAQALRAAELYPLHDRRFPHFVVDFAFIQLEQQRFTDALSLLQRCVSVIHEPAVKALIKSMLARSYGGLGQKEDYERARREAEEIAKTYPEHASVVYYHLAEGARACRSWAEAERHARRSRELALKRDDREMLRLSERTLVLVVGQTGIHSVSVPSGSLPDKLTRELAARLSRWNPQSHPIRRRRVFRNQWVA